MYSWVLCYNLTHLLTYIIYPKHKLWVTVVHSVHQVLIAMLVLQVTHHTLCE